MPRGRPAHPGSPRSPRPSPPPHEQGRPGLRNGSEGRCRLPPPSQLPRGGSDHRLRSSLPRARPRVPCKELWPLRPTGPSLGARSPRAAPGSRGSKALTVSLAVNLTGLQETPEDDRDAAPARRAPAILQLRSRCRGKASRGGARESRSSPSFRPGRSFLAPSSLPHSSARGRNCLSLCRSYLCATDARGRF